MLFRFIKTLFLPSSGLVKEGMEFGNLVADYIGVNRKLFHTAVEFGGMGDNLILLGNWHRAGVTKRQAAEIIKRPLTYGLLTLREKYGLNSMLQEAFLAIESSLGVSSTHDADLPDLRGFIDGSWEIRLREEYGPSIDPVLTDLQRKADLGDVFAKETLGKIFFFGLSVFDDVTIYPIPEKALANLENASESGSLHAKTLLGIIYLRGWEGYKDFDKGVSILEESAEAGCPHAAFILADLYQEGVDAPKDVQSATKWYSVMGRNVVLHDKS